MIKISDRGGGLPKSVERRLWEYGFTTANKSRRENQIAGYGVGLPLARLYARYFGGDINIHHMYGHGSEVLINLNRLGETHELDVSSASDSDREGLSLRSDRRSLRTKERRARSYA
jgi:signal transduction histidine kinase